MSESIKPVGEDLYPSIEDLADFASEIALDVYQSQLNKGSTPTESVKAAIESATNVMLDSGLFKRNM